MTETVAALRHRALLERAKLQAAQEDAAGHQNRVLRELLKANAWTKFGVEHEFARIQDADEFRKAMPIRGYDELAPWIERAAAGERTVLTADEPVVFFMSSGTTGDNKKIPITPGFMRTAFFPFFFATCANFVEHFPEVVAREDSTLNLKHDPLVRPRTTASGKPHAGASQVDVGAAFGEPLAVEPGTRAPWSSLPPEFADTDHLEKTYARLRLAVEADLRCVVGINPAMVAALPHQLRQWWPRIAEDLRAGTLAGRPHGEPNVARAEELERLAEYHGTLLPAHVWPNLELIYCWTGGMASLYLTRLRESFGSNVTLLPAPLAASEGPTAVALDRHRTAGSLVVTAAFYEFVDADEELRPDSTTLLVDELEEGREYQVIYSHVGGMYRYAGGDVVRVVDRVRGVPRVEYAGRRDLSNVAGERLRESHVITALHAALGSLGLEAHNATCRPVGKREPRYEFAIAPTTPLSPCEVRMLGEALDLQLGRLAPGYRSAREQGRLGEPLVHPVAADAFFLEWQRTVESGIRQTQVKDRTFQRDDAAWQRLVGAAT